MSATGGFRSVLRKYFFFSMRKNDSICAAFLSCTQFRYEKRDIFGDYVEEILFPTTRFGKLCGAGSL